MNIKQVCDDLNANASNYRIGNLQEIRKSLKNLVRKPTSDLFNTSTISTDWAFHVGGRTELQFNIGNEKEGLRYGFAFSLEPSQTLPDPKVLCPKILKLNSMISSNTSYFTDLNMWIWDGNGRSKIGKVREISDKEINDNAFIFIGKIKQNPTIMEILETFDYLLDTYIAVENDKYVSLSSISTLNSALFTFKQTNYNLVINKTVNSIARSTNVEVRHTLIQLELIKQLSSKYGANNVVAEHPHQGNRIDVVVNDKGNIYFYEIKVSYSARSCIRQAIGQLFEYSYYPDLKNASKLFVVGEPPLDYETTQYLKHLNTAFSIPIDYISVIV